MKKRKNKKGGNAKRTVRMPYQGNQKSQEFPTGVFIMAFIVKLGLHLLSVPQKITLARRVLEYMTGNSNFPSPLPMLADIVAATDALELAQQALPGGPAATEIRNLREKEWDVKMSNLQAYVESIAQGDPEIALSSGMALRDPKKPVGILPAPEWVIVRVGVATGSAKLRWKANRKSSGYRIEATTDPSLGWPMVFQSEKASIKIDGLTPGVKYYFRVATLSRAGYEGYGPVVTIRPNFAQD